MNGLIIKEPWIDLILDGKKTWEIRGSSTHIRDPIALIRSKSGLVVGTANIIDCIPLHGPDEVEKILNNHDKHHVPLGGIPYDKPYAWLLDDAVRWEEPLPYKHPQGAVIWVKDIYQRIKEAGY